MPSEAHEQLVQLFLDNPAPPGATLADQRAGFDAFLAAQPVPEKAEFTEASLGGVPVEWVSTAASHEDRVVFYLHGGGYAMGSVVGYRGFTSRVAQELRARVVAVEYRLAPEAPYPAGFHDAVSAYRGLLAEGVPADRIVVAGDSGSVGFVLALTTWLRDANVALPAAVVGFCPWVDLAVGETIADAADVGDPLGSREALKAFSGHYLRSHSPTDSAVNALYGELHDLPPMLLIAATRDVGYQDALTVAQLARRAGVDVTVTTHHGLFHNFQLAAHLPEAAEALAEAGAFVGRHLPDNG